MGSIPGFFKRVRYVAIEETAGGNVFVDFVKHADFGAVDAAVQMIGAHLRGMGHSGGAQNFEEVRDGGSVVVGDAFAFVFDYQAFDEVWILCCNTCWASV